MRGAIRDTHRVIIRDTRTAVSLNGSRSKLSSLNLIIGLADERRTVRLGERHFPPAARNLARVGQVVANLVGHDGHDGLVFVEDLKRYLTLAELRVCRAHIRDRIRRVLVDVANGLVLIEAAKRVLINHDDPAMAEVRAEHVEVVLFVARLVLRHAFLEGPVLPLAVIQANAPQLRVVVPREVVPNETQPRRIDEVAMDLPGGPERFVGYNLLGHGNSPSVVYR